MRFEIQKNLFENKKSFNAIDFQNKCINDEFINCISKGITYAFAKLVSADLETRYRVKSDTLHDMAFYKIQELVNGSSLFDKVVFHSDVIGNKRLWFSYNGYAFILKKAESEGNKSSIGQIIDAQEAENHFITISYCIDELWNSISSISLQYIKNKDSIMTLYIPVISSDNMCNISDNTEGGEIAPATAKLKVTKKKAE